MPDEGPSLAQTRIAYLEQLGDGLRERGFVVRLTVPRGRPPSLHVVNPRASALAENILAEGGRDGWWFWWSWAERIAPVDELEEATVRVSRVLAEANEYSW